MQLLLEWGRSATGGVGTGSGSLVSNLPQLADRRLSVLQRVVRTIDLRRRHGNHFRCRPKADT